MKRSKHMKQANRHRYIITSSSVLILLVMLGGFYWGLKGERDPMTVYVGHDSAIALKASSIEDLQEETIACAAKMVTLDKLLNVDISYNESIEADYITFNYCARSNQGENGLMSLHCESDGGWKIISASFTEYGKDTLSSQYDGLIDNRIAEKNMILKEYISSNYDTPQNISATVYNTSVRVRDNLGGNGFNEKHLEFDLENTSLNLI